MNFTPEQLAIAARLDAKVEGLLNNGYDDITIFVQMHDKIPDFKRLMDTAQASGLEELCRRYDALYYYAKLLESMAEGIASGRLVVPP